MKLVLYFSFDTIINRKYTKVLMKIPNSKAKKMLEDVSMKKVIMKMSPIIQKVSYYLKIVLYEVIEFLHSQRNN